MKRSARRVVLGLAVVILLPVVLTLALWGWVLSSDETLNNPVASYVGWPVACSVRGCITTKTWQSHYRTRQAFAKAVEQEAPQPVKALTTLLRQHLVEHAFLRTPVTAREAARYREEILGARDEGQVLLASGLTIEEYDQFVILPLLQQEALKQQNSVESSQELYRQLAADRSIVVLLWRLRWDSERAEVMAR